MRIRGECKNGKSPRMGDFPFSQIKVYSVGLFNGVLKSLCCAELWNASRSNLNSFTCLRVTSCTSCARLHGENAKTCDRNFTAFLKSLDNFFDHTFHNFFGLYFCTANFAVNKFNECLFVHNVCGNVPLALV